jgi:hypothetical protein
MAQDFFPHHIQTGNCRREWLVELYTEGKPRTEAASITMGLASLSLIIPFSERVNGIEAILHPRS